MAVRLVAGYFVWRSLRITNLAVANPHKKSLGRYDCDIVRVQSNLLQELLGLMVRELKRNMR